MQMQEIISKVKEVLNVYEVEDKGVIDEGEVYAEHILIIKNTTKLEVAHILKDKARFIPQTSLGGSWTTYTGVLGNHTVHIGDTNIRDAEVRVMCY